MLNLRFNYHDPMHRKTCFKKGSECRFEIPKQVQDEGRIMFEDDPNQMFEWKFINGESRKLQDTNFYLKETLEINS